MLDNSIAILKANGIVAESMIVERTDSKLPFEDNSFDRIISFYALEHIHPLQPYIKDLYRILKPGGKLIGAIPSEGGIAWGLGRFLTSRRWFKANSNIDPDKIICWEHPNFASDVMGVLEDTFQEIKKSFWPISIVPILDCNLIVRFSCQKLGN